ncbi:epithelial splicing regulatory protein 1 [Echinococcus multilocularis]|uniref:Epithelial splicing regulatory protein 1 n=1 Tax=Echinococcus multilocularis TaxID=6211 RepID=A0A068Y3P6_ECHMU|nr:epithelial splicing regulatory protein 1 [Echinococcus multilocularis]
MCTLIGHAHMSNTQEESIKGTSPCYSPLIDRLVESSQISSAGAGMNSERKAAVNGATFEAELNHLEEQQQPDYLVLLQIASFGKQGAELGTDESAVSMLTAKIFDIHAQSTTGPEWQIYVRQPHFSCYSEVSNKGEKLMDISCQEEVDISEECINFTGLKVTDLRDAPSLLEALESLDTWLRSQGLYHVCNGSESSNVSRKSHFELAVDGGAGLRLVLHPTLTQPMDKTYASFPYLCRFIDLKKVYMLLYPNTQSRLTLTEMMQDLNLSTPDFLSSIASEQAIWTTAVVNSLVNGNSLLQNEGSLQCQQLGYWPRLYCRTMAKLCAKMTADGADWNVYEGINIHYQPKFIKSTEVVVEGVVVRARGLPWQTTDAEVQHFFRGLNIAPGGIALVLSKAGRRNGEAVIRFTSREQRDLALRKHKHHMNQRYIEIYAAQSAEFVAVAQGETQEAEVYLSRFTTPSQSLLRMRGLPYIVSAEEIIAFFAKTDCQVQFDREGILFVNRKDGRATGDAFVMFATDAAAERALKNHRQHIGNRYIELFRSTPAEVNQVMNAVLKQSTDIFPRVWPSAYDQGSFLSQTGPLLEIQNPSVFTSAPKGLLIPSPTFTMPLLNIPSMGLTTLTALGGFPPEASNLSASHLMRMKGMPPGTTVNDILNFLGVYWQAVNLHGIHLIYTATGEPSGEAFVRFISEQAVQTVMANKQGHAITNTATGAQTKVELSRATSAEILDFVSYPVSQPTLNWSNSAGFGAPVNSYQLFPGAAALYIPLLMQLRGVTPSTAPEVFTSIQKAGFTLAAPQTTSTINVGTDILCQSGIRAGSST